MSEKKPSEQRISAIPPFGLRMLPELRRQIEDAAALSGRSLNAEIVARLEASFSGIVPDTSVSGAVREAAMAATAVALQGFHDARNLGPTNPEKADAAYLEISAALWDVMRSPDPYRALMQLRNRIVHPEGT